MTGNLMYTKLTIFTVFFSNLQELFKPEAPDPGSLHFEESPQDPGSLPESSQNPGSLGFEESPESPLLNHQAPSNPNFILCLQQPLTSPCQTHR